MVNDYKSKNDALTCGLYRDIMLLEYAKKNLLMALIGLERTIDRVFPGVGLVEISKCYACNVM